MVSAYTLFDSSVALFKCEANGSIGDLVYSGECQESLEVAEEVTILDCVTHGRRKRRKAVSEVSYRISMSSVLTTFCVTPGNMQFQGPEPVERYFLVVLYFCPESGSWIKETFTGVTSEGRSWRSTGEQFDFSAPLSAERKFREGRCDQPKPDMNPAISGFVRFVSPTASAEIYEYSFLTGDFVSPGDFSTLAGINEGADAPSGALWYCQIDGTVVAWIDLEGLFQIDQLIATGDFSTVGADRVEFWFAGDLIAVIDSDGSLFCRDFNESTTDPQRLFAFVFADGSNWLATLDLSGIYIPGINEA